MMDEDACGPAWQMKFLKVWVLAAISAPPLLSLPSRIKETQ